MKILGTYGCDKGSLVVNGICISNGIGDGEYDIYYFDNAEEAKEMSFKEINNDFWVDLRFTDLKLWTCDCDKNCKKITITKENTNADALLIFKDYDGNIALVKYF